MMLWDIPFVSQYYDGGASSDPLGCWYASACMVGYAFGEGPRLGVPHLYKRSFETAPVVSGPGNARVSGVGHYPLEMSSQCSNAGWIANREALLKNEQLRPMMAPQTWCHDPRKIAAVLRKFGPLIVTMQQSRATYSHFVVLIGVADRQRLIVHEPDVGPSRRVFPSDILSSVIAGTHPILRKVAPLERVRRHWVDDGRLAMIDAPCHDLSEWDSLFS